MEIGNRQSSSFLITGITVSLIAGLMDTILDLVHGPRILYSNLFRALFPVAMASILVFLTYLAAWLVLVPVARKRVESKSGINVLSGIFVLIFWFLVLIGDAVHLTALKAEHLLRMGLIIGLLLVLLIWLLRRESVFRIFQRLHDHFYGWSMGLLFVAFEIFLFVWMLSFYLDPVSLAGMLFTWLALTVIGSTIFLCIRGMNRKRMISGFAGLVVLFFAVTPALFILTIPSPRRPLPRSVPSADAERPYSVFLITVDCLRPDFLSCYGDSPVETPHIDGLADDGIIFRNAYSTAPWTLPSFGSVMTGLSPLVHGTMESHAILPDTLKTLAEWMQQAGYRTAAVVDNFFVREMHKGFEWYESFPKPSMNAGYSMGARLVYHNLFRKAFQEKVTTTDLTDRSIAAIERFKAEPLFFWLHYFDPHVPYAPPSRYLPKTIPVPSIGPSFGDTEGVRSGTVVPDWRERLWIRQLYSLEIKYVDDQLGRLIEWLKENSLYEESLIILSSDHGEEFWEHGGFEHGHALYNEVLHVPLVIKLPGSFDPPARKLVEERVSLEQILPTILDIAGIPETPEYTGLYKPFLRSLWIPQPVFEAFPIVSTGVLYYEDQISVIHDHHKYIRKLISQEEQVFNLNRDAAESINLYSEKNLFLKSARMMLDRYEEESAALREGFGLDRAVRIELDRAALEHLKSLGYIR